MWFRWSMPIDNRQSHSVGVGAGAEFFEDLPAGGHG